MYPQPLDLILFHSSDGVSRIIEYVQKERIGRGDYSHCGLVVLSSWFPHLADQPETLYLWDSIMDTRGIGSRLVPLQEAIDDYVKWFPDARVASCALLHPPTVEPGPPLARLYGQYYDASYNLCCLCCAAFPFMRRFQCKSKHDKSVFCSEMVALAYQALGIIGPNVDTSHVIPLDFLGNDEDGLPRLVGEPVVLISKPS